MWDSSWFVQLSCRIEINQNLSFKILLSDGLLYFFFGKFSPSRKKTALLTISSFEIWFARLSQATISSPAKHENCIHGLEECLLLEWSQPLRCCCSWKPICSISNSEFAVRTPMLQFISCFWRCLIFFLLIAKASVHLGYL